MKFDMTNMFNKVTKFKKISIDQMIGYELDDDDFIKFSGKLKINSLSYPSNGYCNFKCDIELQRPFSRSFVFLQPYGDYDIPNKIWKKCWYKQIIDHCCAIDDKGIVYIVYKFQGVLSLDAMYKIDDEKLIEQIMNGNIDHKRPYRFTFYVEDLMAFITKEFGYDNLRKSLQVKFNVV